MKLTDAEILAKKLMSEWLSDEWEFRFDNAVRRFGVCYPTRKLITLSKALVELNDESQVRDTILHEIAHGLAPIDSGHDAIWRERCRLVGANPERTYDGAVVVRPKARWSVSCRNCDFKTTRNIRTKLVACSRCCNKYNGGKWSAEYLLRYTRQ